MKNPCMSCLITDCMVGICEDYHNYEEYREMEEDRNRLKKFQLEINESFCANFDNLRNTYLKEHNLSNDEKLIVYDVFNFLKNNEQGK